MNEFNRSFKRKSYLVLFVAVLGITDTGCQNPTNKPSNSVDKEQVEIKSQMQRDFNFTATSMDFSEFEGLIYKQNESDIEAEIDLWPFVLGKKFNYEDYSIANDIYPYKFLSDDRLTNIQENKSEDPFDHEIILLKDDTLKSILIKLYAPQHLLPKFDCPEAVYENQNHKDSINAQLDRMFSCLSKKEEFAKKNYERYIEAITKLQKRAMNKFILNFLEVKGLDYEHPTNYRNPDFFIRRDYLQKDEGNNNYTGNLSLGWIKGKVITLITFCTPKYRTGYKFDDDYFEQIEDYQIGKKKYPILRCLITTVGEAKKLNFINIYKFLRYESPLESETSQNGEAHFAKDY